MNGSGPLLPGMNQHDKNLPALRQKSGESEHMFLERIETATSDLINEIKMEAHHNVIVNRNKSGVVMGVQKGNKKNIDAATRRKIRKSVQDFHLGKKPDAEKMAKKEKMLMKKLNMTQQTSEGGSQKKRLGKKQRQKLKMAPKKLEKELDGMGRRFDEVKFGERVDEPPHLKKRPRGVDPNSKPSVKGLLLTQMLSPKNQNVSSTAKIIQEQRRMDVVQAYRDLKASRRNDKPS
uniref:Coiled-coil domain-containing protein 137 n=1 Tax=Lygus hesperus TaxID=30085 RepID=A0A0A9XGX3_LYGHE